MRNPLSAGVWLTGWCHLASGQSNTAAAAAAAATAALVTRLEMKNPLSLHHGPDYLID